MLTVERIDPRDRKQIKRFVEFPFRLYLNQPNWVPPILIDLRTALNPQKHPFYEHSAAESFLAQDGNEVVGRITALENKNYNQYHESHQAQFYYFDCINEQEVALALFDEVYNWAHSRGLDQVVGPKGFGALDGYGLLVEGFEHRQMMTMMNYNHPYYASLLEELGFRKLVDFVSCYLKADQFRLPERIHRIAERVLTRGNLAVKRFKNKRELIAWAPRIGQAYNKAFVGNWEYTPLTDNEIQFLTDNIMQVANPKLIKVITHEDDVVGFLFAFPDVSAALQRSRGRLLPLGIVDLLLEMQRTKWVALNGAGILPEFQGRGGNALLYTEMERTITEYKFEHADLTQVAESALQMRRDLENLGGEAYKNHRVYVKDI
jgi:hypothetical protein